MFVDARKTGTCLFALILSLSLTACGSNKQEQSESPEPTKEETAQVTTGEEATGQEQADTQSEAESTSTTTESSTTVTANQRVGAEGIGFVDVPADWVTFKDTAGGTDLQWSDLTGTSIVTMNTFDMESVPEEERASFDAKRAAESVWISIESNGGEDVTGAEVQLAGKTAYQVYCFYPTDGTFLVTWNVADDAGVIHYVSAEGPNTTIMDIVALVEQTYAFTE